MARVVASFGRQVIVMHHDGTKEQCNVLGRKLRPITGDFVRCEPDGAGRAVVAEVLPRTNAFPRVDRRGRRVDLVANLDTVVVVVAPHPAPSRDLIDKYLIACHAIGIKAAIFLNKFDLLSEQERKDWEARLQRYASIGVAIARGNTRPEAKLGQLADLLAQGTGILVGQSGVGKSSIIGALIPEENPRTNEISHATGKGRHTTTTAHLYDLPGNGSIVDSPGVWEYGLWEMAPSEIESGFHEFGPFAERCRFNNCLHLDEPNCAVRQGVEDQKIHTARYKTYVRLQAYAKSR